MSGPILMRAKSPIMSRPTNKRAQTCGSRCYNANNPVEHCVCPCGGVNHGVGLAKALTNAQAMKDANADVIFNDKGMNEALDLIAKGLATVPVHKVAKRAKKDVVAEHTEALLDKVAEMPLVTEINLKPEMNVIRIAEDIAAEALKRIPIVNAEDAKSDCDNGTDCGEGIVMTPVMQTIKKQCQSRDAKGHFIKA